VSETDTTTDAAKAEFLAKLKAFEGMEIDSLVGPDAVNQAMIRHWVEAMGDTNPVYVDPDAAAATVHGEIIAPPVMLQAWTMQGIHGNVRIPGEESANPQTALLNLLESQGFVGVVATDCDQEYDRMLHLGDHLMTRSVVDSVSEEKATGLGVGHFVTTRIEYLTLDGEPVGRQLFRILKFRPGTGTQATAPAPGAEATARPPRPRPGTTHDNLFFFEGAKEHRLLVQRCAACQALRHPPQPRCDRCGSYDWDTLEATGKGTVYSFVVNHYPQVPAFDYPLPIGLIELAEGTRLVAQIVDCPVEEITIGMPVEVTWIEDGDLTVPAFRPVRVGASAP
jgi:uncharacterized OB-fold protein/acyl dehydratase